MSNKSQMLPIFCTQDKEHPHKVGMIGFNDYGIPIISVQCHRHHNKISMINLATMLQSWRDLLSLHGDIQAIEVFQSRLKKALGDLEADLQDRKQEQSAVTESEIA